MKEMPSAELTLIATRFRRGGLAVSRGAISRSFGLDGHIHVVEELVGSPYNGVSVSIRFSSSVNEDWLARIERDREVSSSIGLVQIRENLQEKEYDFDGEVEIESAIMINVHLFDGKLAEVFYFLHSLNFKEDLTYISAIMSGNNIPHAGKLLEFTPLDDIPYDETKHYSLQSIKIW